MDNLAKNDSIFSDLIGHQIVGVERFDGRLLVMLTNGESTRLLEVDREAKIKKVR